jgi:tRNA-dihydrouridine synthase
MIGRAAQGRPWIFSEIAHYLAHGSLPPPPRTRDVQGWLTDHLHDHYALYGEFTGVRSARKHIGWAVRSLPGGESFRAAMNGIDDCGHSSARSPTTSMGWPKPTCACPPPMTSRANAGRGGMSCQG